jgi:dipeptidyl aminopeptidase/acylaminoacyl peptidase
MDMKLFKTPMAAAILGVAALGLSAPASTPVQAQASQTVPIDVWALRNVVNTVQVSPDGKHLLVHKVDSKEGDYLLQIFKTDDLSKPLRTLNANPMEIINASWVSDNIIFGAAWQEVRKRVTRPEENHRDFKAYFYNLEKNKFSAVDGNFGIESILPKEPNHILVRAGNAIPDASGVDPFAAFRPASYYKFDLRTGGRSLVIKGNEKYGNLRFDVDGNPRFAEGYDRQTQKLSYYYRAVGDGSWKPFGEKYDFDEHENLYRRLGGMHGLAGIDGDDPNIGYMIDNRNGEDKTALYKFDFRTGQIGEKVFQTEDADVMGVQTHSIPGNNRVVAARYPGAKYERHWFDEEEKALHEALEKQIPYSHQLSISSRSRDGKTMVVRNSGPRDPGSFWLVKDGKMAKLGSTNPLVNPQQLSDVKYIRYKARDGRIIPAYVTIPKGEGPFPLVVQHHGGPHVNAVQGYNEIGQMLANNGYMVLYPQNRISTGWGKAHFDAGYGEHGLAMQDDKDDGALYLIEQGLADPNRVAFYGWSYGGYAAFVASQRENNIYQCAITMAGVSSPAKSYRARSGPGGAKALDDWAKRRGMIGINPIEDVAKTNIPILVAHGDMDSRVRYYHLKDYKKAMEKAGKGNYAQYLTLKGVDHNNLMFNHQKTLYTKMLDFLANDCGPDGL